MKARAGDPKLYGLFDGIGSGIDVAPMADGGFAVVGPASMAR